MSSVAHFNRLPVAAAREMMLRCCASARWATRMVGARPFDSVEAVCDAADLHWRAMAADDFLEAFAAHPVIGGVADGDEFAREEQAGMTVASSEVDAALAKYNREYVRKFGFIFIVCARGKSGAEMLELLRGRLTNSREQEIINAAEEQRNIMQLRIQKLFGMPIATATTTA